MIRSRKHDSNEVGTNEENVRKPRRKEGNARGRTNCKNKWRCERRKGKHVTKKGRTE